MGGQSVLRSFLVALGFRIDATGLNGFNRAVGSADRGVHTLGRRAAWAATAVIGAVAVMARSLDKLYFTSLRSGDTAANIENFAYGMQFAGISADKARGMVEAFSLELRRNPGKLALLRALGVQSNEATGQLNELAVVLKRFPDYVAAGFADQFGVNMGDLIAMQKTAGERARQERDARQFAKDIDLDIDKATKTAHEFDNVLRQLQERARLVGMAFFETFQQPIKAALDYLNTTMKGAGELMAEQRRIQEGGKVPEPGESGYIPGMQRGNWADIFRIAGYGLSEASWNGINALTDTDLRAALGQSYEDTKARTAWPAPQVSVTVNTRDPETTVSVDGQPVGQVPLGPSTARNAGTAPR